MNMQKSAEIIPKINTRFESNCIAMGFPLMHEMQELNAMELFLHFKDFLTHW